jgi:hypothetical protein
VELIVLNIGKQAGVLSTQVFSMFVVMAIVTTCMTPPLLHFIYLRHRKMHPATKEQHTFLAFTADIKTGTNYTSITGFAYKRFI